jgi:hypothetical protein
MTEYRKINNGHWDFLQYKKQKRFLWVFKYTKWFYVWNPYYHRTYGRSLDSTGADCFVNSLYQNLDSFVKEWVDIGDYFKYAHKEQDKLEKEVNEINKNRNQLDGKVTFF